MLEVLTVGSRLWSPAAVILRREAANNSRLPMVITLSCHHHKVAVGQRSLKAVVPIPNCHRKLVIIRTARFRLKEEVHNQALDSIPKVNPAALKVAVSILKTLKVLDSIRKALDRILRILSLVATRNFHLVGRADRSVVTLGIHRLIPLLLVRGLTPMANLISAATTPIAIQLLIHIPTRPLVPITP